ncbi:uncharacterized protein LOC144996791 [Oryzias latipes]
MRGGKTLRKSRRTKKEVDELTEPENSEHEMEEAASEANSNNENQQGHSDTKLMLDGLAKSHFGEATSTCSGWRNLKKSSSHNTSNCSSLIMLGSMLQSSLSQTAELLANICKFRGLFKVQNEDHPAIQEAIEDTTVGISLLMETGSGEEEDILVVHISQAVVVDPPSV